jgi:hypothetical protein
MLLLWKIVVLLDLSHLPNFSPMFYLFIVVIGAI